MTFPHGGANSSRQRRGVRCSMTFPHGGAKSSRQRGGVWWSMTFPHGGAKNGQRLGGAGHSHRLWTLGLRVLKWGRKNVERNGCGKKTVR